MRLWDLLAYDTIIGLSHLPSFWGMNKCEYNEVETPTRCTNTTGSKSDTCCHVVQRFRRSGVLSIRHNGRERKENIKHTAFGPTAAVPADRHSRDSFFKHFPHSRGPRKHTGVSLHLSCGQYSLFDATPTGTAGLREATKMFSELLDSAPFPYIQPVSDSRLHS